MPSYWLHSQTADMIPVFAVQYKLSILDRLCGLIRPHSIQVSLPEAVLTVVDLVTSVGNVR